MTYTVLGTGAVGGYYGAKLQKSGKDVRFIARSDYTYIKEHGLEISSVDGDFNLPEVAVYTSEEEIPYSDVILVSTKTTTNAMLPSMLQPLVKDGTVIFVLQNGLGMEEELQKAFPQAIILGGMCFICSQKTGEGHITHFDEGAIFAAPLHTCDLPLLKKIGEDFSDAGIKFDIFENLVEQRWKKLLWNIPFNSLTVILHADTGEIINSEYALSLVKKLMDEVLAGAKSLGCNLGVEMAEKMVGYTIEMKPYLPSMRIDFDSKRAMEIEYMFRKPIEVARLNGVEMPFTEFVADQLSFLQSE